MKKKYTKPVMAIENFTLTERIASCDDATVFNTLDGCQVNYDFESLFEMWRFLMENDNAFWPEYSCTDIVNQGPDYGDGKKLCYHTSVGTMVFSS